MTTLILIVFALLFSVYGILFAIQCGHGLMIRYPSLVVKQSNKLFLSESILRYNNLLLMSLTICILIILKKSIFHLGSSLEALLIISLASLLAITFTNKFFTGNAKKNLSKLFRSSYLVVTYLVPLSFAATGTFLFTGKQFWATIPGWFLMITVVLGLTATGLSFFNSDSLINKKIKQRQIMEGFFAAWLVSLGFILPIALEHYNVLLVGVPLSVLEIIILVSLMSYAFISIKHKKSHELFHYTFLITAVTPIIFAYNIRPYFIFNNISLRTLTLAHMVFNNYYWLAELTLALAIFTIFAGIYSIVNCFDLTLSIKKKPKTT